MRCLKVIAALMMLFALNTAVCFALEEETTDNYSSFYESSGADSLDDSLPDDVKDTIDSAGIDISNWQSMLSPSPKKIISMFADIARGSFKKPIKDMVIIAGVVVLVGLIKGTAAAENFSEPLNIVIGCAVAITVFASSAGVISQGMSAVETTSDFMLALIPVLAGIITAAGNPTLALTYGSFAMAAAQAAAQTAGNIIMPLCGVFGVIAVVMIDLPVVLQLTARIILLKLLGVLSSSMGDDTTGEVLDTLSSALTVINAAVIFTAALFIISTGIVISVKAGA